MSSTVQTPADGTAKRENARPNAAVKNRGFLDWLMSEKGLRREGVFVLGALALMTFFACYLRVFSFGLYEDDLNQTRFWAYPAAQMGDYIVKLFTSGAGGRPIGLTFLRGGFWAGNQLGGMPVLYFMGFLVFVSNALMTYKIARYVAPAAIAALAGFMFVLFPADALKFTVVRGLAVQPSLTFGLGAMLFYINRRYIAAYGFAALAVGVYEFGILPFLTAPFFIFESWREKLRRVLVHGALCAGVLGGIILARLQFAAAGHLDELTPLSKQALFERFFTAWTSGPWTSLKGFWGKPQAFFRDFENWQLIVVIAVAAIAIFVLRSLWTDDAESQTLNSAENKSLSERLDDFFSKPNPYWLLIAGVIAWVVAYSMALSESRYPPTKDFGRTTSVHTAATFGASIAFAAFVWISATWTKALGANPKKFLIPIVAAYLSTLGGFHAVVQQACVDSWALQEKWWRQINAQVDDWRDGTVVIVDYRRAPNTRYVYSMSWATQVIAENMFYFPKNWKHPPTTVFANQLTPYAEVIDGKLMMKRRPWFEKTEVRPDQIIFFKVGENDTLTRSQGIFQFKDFRIKVSPPGPAAEFETKPLYDFIIGDADAEKN